MTISGTARAVAAAAALTLVAVATTAPAQAATHGRTGDPLVGAPKVGTCSTMTPKQGAAFSDRSEAVACSKAHTAQVAGVVRLPKRLSFSTATNQQLFRVVAAGCAPKVDALLGRNAATRDLSAYSLRWFGPTRNQRTKGARWLSCSVVLVHVTRLQDLPVSTSPFLPQGTLPDSVARCLTRSVFLTLCKASHAWRATGTFTVTGKFPGAKALDKKATRRCPSRVHSKAFRWTYADKDTWNLTPDRVVVCYTKTRA